MTTVDLQGSRFGNVFGAAMACVLHAVSEAERRNLGGARAYFWTGFPSSVSKRTCRSKTEEV